MSRFTFGFLLGAGAGWAVGSGKAADWKRALEDRRAVGADALDRSASMNDIAPAYGKPDDVTAR